MDKKRLSESDICDKFIRPAMEQAGWNGMDQIYREYPLRAGRVVVRGHKAQRDKSTVLRADYALFFKANLPLAVVEAKDNQHAVGAGMAQAIEYPPGVKSYNKTKPIRIDEFDAEKTWWGSAADGFAARVESERAWKVSIDQIKAANYNLDQKNPHAAEEVSHDPEHLLPPACDSAMHSAIAT